MDAHIREDYISKEMYQKHLHEVNVSLMQEHVYFDDYVIDEQQEMRPEYATNQRPPQQIQVVQEKRVEQDRLDAKKEKKKLQKRREKETGDGVGLPLDAGTVQGAAYNQDRMTIKQIKNSQWGKKEWLQEKHNGYTNQEILQQIKDNDHSHFENLDGLLRDYLAIKEMKRFNDKYLNGYSPSQEEKIEANEASVQLIVDRLEEEKRFFDPVMRLGLSQFANLEKRLHGEDFKSIYRAVDNEIAKRIMVRTLTHKMSTQEEYRYCEHLKKNNPGIKDPEKELERQQEIERAKRAQMAKQLMLMHIGRLQIIKKGQGKDIDVPMASVLAHCSRTMIITPRCRKLSEERLLWDSILRHHNTEGTYSNLAEIESRWASTHSLEQRRTDKQEGMFGVEKKKNILTPNILGQTGMNVAIGGMGASGVDGKILDQNGTCGHVYGMHKISEGIHNGAYLFGYESDAAGYTNQLGHKHTARAKGEKASSFLCHRVDEIGDKYGGRQADVSGISTNTIVYLMNCVDKLFEKNDDKVKEVSEKLCGGYMDYETMRDFIRDLIVYITKNNAKAIQIAMEVVDVTRPYGEE